ncbi:MAG: proteasome activator [Acidimicrobiales bacterium]
MNTDPPAPASPTPPTGGEPGAQVLVPVEIAQPSDLEDEEVVAQPAKLMRIASMAKQLLDEVRLAPLDEASRSRMKEIYHESIRQLEGALSPELAAELDRLAIPFDDGPPSDAELRVAQGQLVGWLAGLFQGIQATLFVQQVATQRQLEQMRGVGPTRGPRVGQDAGPVVGEGERTPYL